jgi:acyl-coenzyme A thioesterase PaaI-like protein
MNLKSAGVHSGCVMCGEGNPFGLKLKFVLDGRDGACAVFKGGERFQGYDGILHGGVISAVLDSAMTNCLFLHGVQALTGKLEVRFLKPAPCRSGFIVSAHMLEARGPLYKVEAAIACGELVFARAEAKFMRREVD